MLNLEKVSKQYTTRRGRVTVLSDVGLQVRPGERLGILGHNGAGKSTLIRLISGVEQPTSGRIQRDMSISWPLAFGGAFLGMLSGLDNFRFICRLYNVDPSEKIDFVEEFCELGQYFREPLRTYSAGMRARLAFAVSMAVEFDCFLIDEIVAVGDARFQAKCNHELFERRGDRAFVIVSHHADFIREHCNAACVLMNGRLHHFPSVDDAYDAYNEHIAALTLQAANDGQGEIALPPVNLSEKNREEALMEQQISGLGSIVTTAIERDLDDEVTVGLIRAFTSGNVEPELFLDTINHLRVHGSVTAAIKFAELVVTFSKNSLFYVVLGDLLYGQNSDKKAIEAFSQALIHDDHSFWGHRNLAITYFKIGSYASCIPHLIRAYELTDDPTQKRELTWHLIDCYSYLEQDVPSQGRAMAQVTKTELVEFTPSYWPELQLLNVRAQGFLAPGVNLQDASFELEVEGTTFRPTDVLFASNSLRRYAAVAGCDSFQCNFILPFTVAPQDCAIRIATPGKGSRLRQTATVGTSFGAPAGLNEAPTGHAARADWLFLQYANEAACLYYSLALAAGDPVDDERYAESLIALGRFHEAEWHLDRVQAASDNRAALDDLSGRLFDLHCSEVARSRVPGWESKVETLIEERQTRDTNDAAALTNLGHYHVHKGQIEQAILDYGKAHLAAGDREVIHFSRGITSARFADAAQATTLDGPALAPARNQLIHLFACDAKYFKRYGAAVAGSSSRAGQAFLHCHIVDPDCEALDLAERLRGKYGLQITSEFFPFANAPQHARIAYYTSARYIVASSIMQMYNAPVLITETDCQINWSWTEIAQWCQGAHFGSVMSSQWNWVPWTKIPAGIAYFDNGEAGQTMACYIRDFLIRVFSDPAATAVDLWTIDQVALWLAWSKHKDHLIACHLPMTSMLNLAIGDKTNILSPDD